MKCNDIINKALRMLSTNAYCGPLLCGHCSVEIIITTFASGRKRLLCPKCRVISYLKPNTGPKE